MKLSTKIYSSMGFLTILMAFLTLYLLMQMQSINEATTSLSSRNIPAIRNAGQFNNDAGEYRIAEIRHIYSSDPAEMGRLEKQMAQQKDAVRSYIANLEKIIISPGTRKSFEEAKLQWNDYLKVSGKMLSRSREHNTEDSVALLQGESRELYESLSHSLALLVEEAAAFADKVSARGVETYATSRLTGISMVTAAILIAVILTLLLMHDTNRQLGKDPGELNNIARRVVGGDYDIDDGSKKLGVYGAIVEMVAALKEHIENARQESENASEQSAKAHAAMREAEAASKEAQTKTMAMMTAADKLEQVGSIVSSASTQLSAQIEQADRGAAGAAQRLSEAATAMNEMNATVQEVARNAEAASGASALTREKAEAGAQVVEKAVRSIKQVHQLSLDLREDMGQLDEHARSINRIMNVISDIADQTNLLALNAAIEAARAGDAGRGFAVVADEVRNLAEKTMASTQDVGNAIQAIQESTTKSMAGVDNAVQQINQATDFASQSGRALEEIVTTVEVTADQVNAIATASEEQSAASEEINQSIVEVNDMARQTAEAMAEAAKAVSDLAAQAQGLTTLIQELKQA